jgi:RNA polymerase sigma-70 factor (ECF subfamily)
VKPTASGQLHYDGLYRAQRGRILSLCRLLLSDAHEAEEVCQDVFLKLFEQCEVRTVPPAPERWLTRVAVNACRDRRRAGWWRRWRERGQELIEADHRAPGPTPEEAFLGLEQRGRIWRVFRHLSPRQQEVFVMRQVEGWSTDEVAEALGLSSGSVKRHLFRAIHHLRAALRGVS